MKELQDVLDGRWAAVRNDVRAQLGDLKLSPDPDATIEQYRSEVADAVAKPARSGRPHHGDARRDPRGARVPRPDPHR